MHDALSTEDYFTCSRGVRITRTAQFDWRVRLTVHGLNGAFGKEWLVTTNCFAQGNVLGEFAHLS